MGISVPAALLEHFEEGVSSAPSGGNCSGYHTSSQLDPVALPNGDRYEYVFDFSNAPVIARNLIRAIKCRTKCRKIY